MERLLNSVELANFLGIAPQTVRLYCSRKQIPFLKINSSVRFSAQNIEEILEKAKRNALAR